MAAERLDAVVEELIGDTDSPILFVQAAEDEDGRDLERLIERCETESRNSQQRQVNPAAATPGSEGPSREESSRARGSDT
jgi:hypothetical protein